MRRLHSFILALGRGDRALLTLLAMHARLFASTQRLRRQTSGSTGYARAVPPGTRAALCGLCCPHLALDSARHIFRYRLLGRAMAAARWVMPRWRGIGGPLPRVALPFRIWVTSWGGGGGGGGESFRHQPARYRNAA